MLCDYKCGNEATSVLKNGKWCCHKSPNSCPSNKKKNSEGLVKAYSEGRKDCVQLDGKRGWAKGNVSANFSYKGKGNHKQVLINERGHCCESCNLAEWLSLPITLELEHIDGDTDNNVKSNLKLLCPNCHSQTLTWRRKKSSGTSRYTEDEMKDAIISSANVHQALTKLGLKWGSSATLMKVKDRLDLKFKNGAIPSA